MGFEAATSGGRPGAPRDAYWDGVRGIAISCVVLMHCSSPSWRQSSTPLDRLYCGIDFLLYQAAACAVPLFIFMSGYWLQRSDVSTLPAYGGFLRHRLSRVLMPYFAWSSIYILIAASTRGFPSIRALAEMLVFGKAAGQLYFVPLICQFYLLLPLFKKAGKAPAVTIAMLTLTVACIGLNCWLRVVSGSDLFLPALLFVFWIPYFVSGFHTDVLRARLTRSVLWLPPLALAFVALEYAWLSRFVPPERIVASTCRFGTMFYSLAVTLVFIWLGGRTRLPSAFSALGRYSFSIYLSHMLVVPLVLTAVDRFMPGTSLWSVTALVAAAISLAVNYVGVALALRVLPGRFARTALGLGT